MSGMNYEGERNAFEQMMSREFAEPISGWNTPLNEPIMPEALPVRISQFLEYFLELHPNFNVTSYNDALRNSPNYYNEADSDEPLKTELFRIVAEYAGVVHEDPVLMSFDELIRLSNVKQRFAAEYVFRYDDMSIPLRQMLDMLFPYGPDVATVDDEQLEAHVLTTYGRPSSTQATFNDIVEVYINENSEQLLYDYFRLAGRKIEENDNLLLVAAVRLGSFAALNVFEESYIEDGLEHVREVEDQKTTTRLKDFVLRVLGGRPEDAELILDRLEPIQLAAKSYVYDCLVEASAFLEQSETDE